MFTHLSSHGRYENLNMCVCIIIIIIIIIIYFKLIFYLIYT